MSRVGRIQGEVKELSPPELAAFRQWFTEFDADAWDLQFEADAGSGRLDALADSALQEHLAGRSAKL